MELTGERQGIGSVHAFSAVSVAFPTRVYESEQLYFSELLNYAVNASSLVQQMTNIANDHEAPVVVDVKSAKQLLKCN